MIKICRIRQFTICACLLACLFCLFVCLFVFSLRNKPDTCMTKITQHISREVIITNLCLEPGAEPEILNLNSASILRLSLSATITITIIIWREHHQLQPATDEYTARVTGYKTRNSHIFWWFKWICHVLKRQGAERHFSMHKLEKFA